MKSFFGGLGLILCGMILAALMSQVPVGFSDADVATIGRKFYVVLRASKTLQFCKVVVR